MKKFIGIIMLVLFFTAVFIGLASTVGIIETSVAFGITILVMAWIFGALKLIIR